MSHIMWSIGNKIRDIIQDYLDKSAHRPYENAIGKEEDLCNYWTAEYVEIEKDTYKKRLRKYKVHVIIDVQLVDESERYYSW